MSSKLGEGPSVHPAFCSTRWVLTDMDPGGYFRQATGSGQSRGAGRAAFAKRSTPREGVSYGLASSIYNSKFKIPCLGASRAFSKAPLVQLLTLGMLTCTVWLSGS